MSSWLNVSDLNEALLQELDCLHPFGQGNREPLFGLKNVVLSEAPRLFGESNFRFSLPDSNGGLVAGVAWRMQRIPEVGQPMDLAVRFSRNYWRDRCTPQMTLIDWKPAGSAIL